MAGLISPFRRDKKNDFASGSGDELLRSQVAQVLMVEGDTAKSSGELPWRTDFGSAVHLARHQRNDAVIADLVRVYARDALKRWLPDLTVTGLEVRQESAALVLVMRFRGANQPKFSIKISSSPNFHH